MQSHPTYPDIHEGHLETGADRVSTIDDSYNQAGPPSFSKSGYPVQVKKGGSYEYRSIPYNAPKSSNDSQRGPDLSSHRGSAEMPTTKRSGSRTKNRKDSITEQKDTDLMRMVQENLKYVTKCKIHNQNYSLFNPNTKQLCCIECLYNNPKQSHKKLQVLSLKTAYPIITESNRLYKAEAKEKVNILDENIKACVQNINTIGLAQEHLVSQIHKEFNELFEELKKREQFLLDSVQEVVENETRRIRNKMEDLEFLKSCFKDAREVDPQQSFELGVHFFAVYHMLKNIMKQYEIQAPLYTVDEFNMFDFGTRNIVKNEIANFGKFLNKSPQKKKVPNPVRGNSTLRNRKRSESASKIAPIFAERSASPTNRSSNTNTKRTITPEPQREKTGKMKSPPQTSYLEREIIKKATKLKTSMSSGKLGTGGLDLLQYQKGEETVPSLFPYNKERFINEILESSQKKPVVSDFEGGFQNPQSDISPHCDNRRMVTEGSANRTNRHKAVMNSTERFADLSPNVKQTAEAIKMGELAFQKSIEGVNNLLLFNDSAILDQETKTTDFFNMLPSNIRHTKLLYRLTAHGASSLAFHERCDHQAPYVVLVKSDYQFVFGYYLPIPIVNEEKYNTCEECFIFSLKNPYYDRVMKFPIKSDKKFIALYQSSKSPCLGSTLQNKQDLWLQFDNLQSSCSVIGNNC